MAGFTPTISSPSQSGFGRPRSYGEDLETKTEVKSQNDTTQQQLKDNNSAWTSFLRVPEGGSSSQLNITRLDTSSEGISVEEQKTHLTFEQIYQKMASEEVNPIREQKQINNVEGSIVFDQKSTESQIIEQESENTVILEKPETPEVISIKKQMLSSAEKTADITSKVSKRGWKESKEVFGAVKDLWKNFIYLKEKKPDPKAKENAEKLAKRKANKAKFMGMLREGISLYYAGMRKMLMELEVKLGTNVLRTEDKNRLLGRNRNASFEGNDSVYAITQTAYAMAEQKKRQKEASTSSPPVRGKASRGQIFTDKNLSGERSGGNNMMSAVG